MHQRGERAYLRVVGKLPDIVIAIDDGQQLPIDPMCSPPLPWASGYVTHDGGLGAEEEPGLGADGEHFSKER